MTTLEKTTSTVTYERILINNGRVRIGFNVYQTFSCSLLIIQNLSIYPNRRTADNFHLSGKKLVDTLSKEEKKEFLTEFKKVIGSNKVVISQQNGKSGLAAVPILKIFKFRKSAKFDKNDRVNRMDGYGVGHFWKYQTKDNL